MQLIEFQITQKCMELANSVLPSNVIIDFYLLNYAQWRLKKQTVEGLTQITTSIIDDKNSLATSSDLILKCKPQIFYSILQGSKNPIRAFLEEEIELFGDVGLALTLYSFLPELHDFHHTRSLLLVNEST